MSGANVFNVQISGEDPSTYRTPLQQREDDARDYALQMQRYAHTLSMVPRDAFDIEDRIAAKQREIDAFASNGRSAALAQLDVLQQQRNVLTNRINALPASSINQQSADYVPLDRQIRELQARVRELPPGDIQEWKTLHEDMSKLERERRDQRRARADLFTLAQVLKYHPYALREAPSIKRPAQREAYLTGRLQRAVGSYHANAALDEPEAPPANDQAKFYFYRRDWPVPQMAQAFGAQ